MPATDARPQGRVFTIKTLHIQPNPDQPRQEFEPVSLANLASSLRQHGMLQPVIVRPLPSSRQGDGAVGSDPAPGTAWSRSWSTGPSLYAETHYYLIAGERRWRAAQLAGLEEVPALIFNASSPQMLELALVENIQREDLSPLEEARAYEHMIRELGMTQEDVARRVGRHRATVANRLRLLNLSACVRLALNERRITEGHARALLPLEEGDQEEALGQVLRRKLSVRETEGLVRRQSSSAPRARRPGSLSAPAPGPPDVGAGADDSALEDALRRALGTKVTLHRQGQGGRIVVEFYSAEELQRVVEQVAGSLDLL